MVNAVLPLYKALANVQLPIVPLVALITPVKSTLVAVMLPLASNEKLPAAISNALSLYRRYLEPS